MGRLPVATDEAEQTERILKLAARVYGAGECEVLVTAEDATLARDERPLCHVTAFDGDPLAALERFLQRQLERRN